MFQLLVFLAVLGIAYSKEFVFVNSHSDTIWVGTLGNDGKPAPENGGFVLGSGEQKSISTDDSWAGRFWPRTGCSFDENGNGHCETGDCGNKLQCTGAGGVPPVSLVEFTLKGDNGQDYYDVSFVDGFNVPVVVQPVNNGQDGDNRFRCGAAGCSNDLNAGCPDGLKVTNDGGEVVACKSSCNAYDTDQYCCRGSYDGPQTCNINDWQVNSASYFKSNCPNAYSYAYDDSTSTYTCDDGSYMITFS